MPLNEQKKAETLKTIHGIFDTIIQDLQNRADPNESFDLLIYITWYRDALIQEVHNQNVTYDHPLRAALALKKLHFSKLEDFPDNLRNFKTESQHSGLYPTTRKIGKVLQACIIPAGVIALGALVDPLYLFLLLLVAPCVKKDLTDAKNAYQDVYEAKKRGKEIYNCYSSLFRKPAAGQPQAPSAPPPPYEAKPLLSVVPS